MENKETDADSFYNLTTKYKIIWIIFAPLALFKINNELCLFWIVGSLMVFMALNIYTRIDKPTMFLFSYLAAILIVLLTILIHKKRQKN